MEDERPASDMKAAQLYQAVFGALPPDGIVTYLFHPGLQLMQELDDYLKKITFSKAAKSGTEVHFVWIMIISPPGGEIVVDEIERFVSAQREATPRPNEFFALLDPGTLSLVLRKLRERSMLQVSGTVSLSGANVHGGWLRARRYALLRYASSPMVIDPDVEEEASSIKDPSSSSSAA